SFFINAPPSDTSTLSLHDALPILPDAVFLGYLTGESLASAYASADIFVFPSTTDTFGNVVIEAQASGLPVIVSDLGGPEACASIDRKSTRLNSSHVAISYAVFCLK